MTLLDDLSTNNTPGGDVKIDVTSTEARVQGYITDQPIERATDWAPVFRRFNLDPDEFEVVDDTVRMTSWDQSKRTEAGDRDVVILYAYSARFRRVTADRIAPEVVDTWRETLRVKSRAKPAPTGPTARPYVLLVADPQLGKKGTAEAVENWQRGVEAHIAEAARLGPAVSSLHVAFMGDEHENVVNSYGNQPHTVELNRSRQLELDYDMRVYTIRKALTLRKPVTASSVISNHGEWTRNAGKEPVTSSNDNSSTFIARQVRSLFDELAPFTGQAVEWTIGEDRPGVLVELGGVSCYFSHGYIEKGRGPSVEVKTRQALERQILGSTDRLGQVEIFNMAHYHHFYANEFEGRTLFGCPALEAERSSEYMLDQFGVWSPPGVLGYLVGRVDGEARPYAHVNVF